MRKLLKRLTGRGAEPDAASITYGAIVAQSRRPALYARDGVPDSVPGRLEMLLLHLALVLPWLERFPGGRELSQTVLDRFVDDMDSNMRELGVGDLSVGKKMRSLASHYVGAAQAYQKALAQADETTTLAALSDAIRRNVGPAAPDVDAAALASYALRLSRHLGTLEPRSADALDPSSLFVEP